MKIENSGKPLTGSISRNADSAAASRLKASTSSESANTAATSGVVAQSAPFDAEKVANIRQAIAEGRFTVRADAVADKLLDSVKELLAK